MKRRWKHIQEKLQFHHRNNNGDIIDDDYYDQLPIVPGFDFYNCLVNGKRYHYSKLKVNIPDTLYTLSDKRIWIYTNSEGCLAT